MNNNIKTIKLTNISIDKRISFKQEDFYIIFDNDNNKAYFCFQNRLKDDWKNLTQHYQNIKEIEFEYEENEKGNKVSCILSHDKSEDIFIT
jgi:hypothetical protein